MMELQTREGQAAHYAAVRMRLSGPPRASFVSRLLLPALPSQVLALPAPTATPEFIAHLRSKADLSSFDMVRIMAFHRGVSFDDIVGPSRKMALCRVRHEMMFIVWAIRGISLPAVGRVFGHRDHTTALNGVRKICRQYGLICDPENRAAAAEIALAILREAGWKPVQDDAQAALQRLVDGAR